MDPKTDTQQDQSPDGAGTNARASAHRPDQAAGAPPCITAPVNSIIPLRHGVDSLYVSVKGDLYPGVEDKLHHLKALAQKDDPLVSSLAEFASGDHVFEVGPRGQGRFPYVMHDAWYWFKLAGMDVKKLPMAQCQVRSEYLTSVGVEAALDRVERLFEVFGRPDGSTKISRIDLFADFVSPVVLKDIPVSGWVARAKRRVVFHDGGNLTGMAFGPGSPVSARIYDKTLEIQRSGKDYLKPLWAKAGWDGESPVYRLEFQLMRSGLCGPLLGPAREALPYLCHFWEYLTVHWLRLAIQNENDATRHRWPTHPLWVTLQQVFHTDPSAPTFERIAKTECPPDNQFFSNVVTAVTGFMAKYGITHFDPGLSQLLQAMHAHYTPEHGPDELTPMVERKVRAKARRYHTRSPYAKTPRS